MDDYLKDSSRTKSASSGPEQDKNKSQSLASQKFIKTKKYSTNRSKPITKTYKISK